jgi:predicted amidohydrolase
MTTGVLRVATCQFAVSSSIRHNSRWICQFLRRAKAANADIVHFPECALSGYVGRDFKSFAGFDWELLRAEMIKIMRLAAELKIWVVLGSSHRLTRPNKPHNSLYLINPRGRIVDRYDKRFCTEADLEHYASGNRFVISTINRVRCSLLICYDLRFPEIYRELKKANVQCIFQSFYNARQEGRTIHTDIMRQTMQCHAATNYFWISMTNSSAYYSAYPSCFIQPDGKIAAQLCFHQPGLMVNTVDAGEQFYDASEPFRELAMKGVLSNGPGDIDDARSRKRTML